MSVPSVPAPAPLKGADLEAFLNGRWIARLALIDDEGFPYVVPVSYDYDGQDFWVIAARRVRFARMLEQRPACALSIAEDARPYRRALVRGHAEIAERPNLGGKWVEHMHHMSARYCNPREYYEQVMGYPRWLIRIVPKSIVSLQGFRYLDPGERVEG